MINKLLAIALMLPLIIVSVIACGGIIPFLKAVALSISIVAVVTSFATGVVLLTVGDE